MKVGQVFDLPPNILYELGHIGKLKNQDETKLIGKYEVVTICSCGMILSSQSNIDTHSIKLHTNGELKGRVIVTYGNKRKRHHNNKGTQQIKNGRTKKDAKRLTRKYVK